MYNDIVDLHHNQFSSIHDRICVQILCSPLMLTSTSALKFLLVLSSVWELNSSMLALVIGLQPPGENIHSLRTLRC